jgi:hypothetical protein
VPADRPATLPIVLVLGAASGAALVVAGLWLAAMGPRLWSPAGPPAVFAGIASLALGQLAFMCLIADRLFPGFARRGAWRVEAVLAVLAIESLAAAWALLLREAW